MIIRKASMEGRFYPSTKSKILSQIGEIDASSRYPVEHLDSERIFGAVLPHAGHIYSGPQTVPFFKLLKQLGSYPDTFIIVHPKHSGTGPSIAVDDSDVWVNAIGEVSTDRRFGHAMKLPFDRKAHSGEHSAEVIIPFLQYYLSNHTFSIVPVCIHEQSYDNARLIAKSIRKAEKELGRKAMVLASCDFSHFHSPDIGVQRDQYVLDEIFSRNIEGVEQAVRSHHLSVCGYGPIMTLMHYAMDYYPKYRMKILARGHSGEVFPSDEVVDYISMIFYQ